MNGEFGNSNDINLTIIGSGMNLTGNLFTLNDVRVDGKFKGELQAKGKIVVSEHGEINGIVKGVNIVIMGKAHGEFEAENNFQVAAGGFFHGNVKTRYINISNSAHFEGTCDISPSHKALELVQPENSIDTAKIEEILAIYAKAPQVKKKPEMAPAMEPEISPEITADKQPENVLETQPASAEEKPVDKPKEQSVHTDDTPPPAKQSIFASKIRQIKSV